MKDDLQSKMIFNLKWKITFNKRLILMDGRKPSMKNEFQWKMTMQDIQWKMTINVRPSIEYDIQ